MQPKSNILIKLHGFLFVPKSELGSAMGQNDSSTIFRVILFSKIHSEENPSKLNPAYAYDIGRLLRNYVCYHKAQARIK